MRYFAFSLLVLFFLFSTHLQAGEVPVCNVLVKSPPVYQVGDRTPILVRDIGDIGYSDPAEVDEVTNALENEHQVVVKVVDDMVGIINVQPSGEVSSLFVFQPATGQELYPNGVIFITTNLRFPLCEGDMFQKTYQSVYFKSVVHECGPITRDSKSGYIFYQCTGPIPVMPNVKVTEYTVKTADFKWQVIPTLSALHLPDDSNAQNK